jgi:nucleotide-binding universal stress UspA family protein
MTDTQEVQILVALNDTPASLKALDRAVNHVLSLKCKYKLYLIHFVALNPPQNFPYLDHLDKGFNLEIQEEEDKIVDRLASKLQRKYYGKIDYSFIKVEGNGEVGPIIEEYIQSKLPNLDMVYGNYCL